MQLHGVDRVLAARRVEPALPAEQSAERDAVEEDDMDEEPRHVCVLSLYVRRGG